MHIKGGDKKDRHPKTNIKYIFKNHYSFITVIKYNVPAFREKDSAAKYSREEK